MRVLERGTPCVIATSLLLAWAPHELAPPTLTLRALAARVLECASHPLPCSCCAVVKDKHLGSRQSTLRVPWLEFRHDAGVLQLSLRQTLLSYVFGAGMVRGGQGGLGQDLALTPKPWSCWSPHSRHAPLPAAGVLALTLSTLSTLSPWCACADCAVSSDGRAWAACGCLMPGLLSPVGLALTNRPCLLTNDHLTSWRRRCSRRGSTSQRWSGASTPATRLCPGG